MAKRGRTSFEFPLAHCKAPGCLSPPYSCNYCLKHYKAARRPPECTVEPPSKPVGEGDTGKSGGRVKPHHKWSTQGRCLHCGVLKNCNATYHARRLTLANAHGR